MNDVIWGEHRTTVNEIVREQWYHRTKKLKQINIAIHFRCNTSDHYRKMCTTPISVTDVKYLIQLEHNWTNDPSVHRCITYSVYCV